MLYGIKGSHKDRLKVCLYDLMRQPECTSSSLGRGPCCAGSIWANATDVRACVCVGLSHGLQQTKVSPKHSELKLKV